ncbi:MAG: S41 family peptidase [Bacteroidota bacterium]
MRNFITYFFFLFIGITTGFTQSNTTMFSKEAVLSDLDYLYAALKDAHYDLFACTPKKKYDSIYTATKATLQKDSLTSFDTHKMLQRFVAHAKNGHTAIEFPIPAYQEYAGAGGTLFPLEIAFDDNKPLIRKNWSNQEEIAIGSELLKINGMPMDEILSKIYQQISAERTYFKQVKLELYSFPRFYWQVFGQQDTFEIEVKTETGNKSFRLTSVPLIDGFELKRNEVFNAKKNLKFFSHSAYLNPGDFSGDETAYQKFIDSAFAQIKTKGSKNLIVDFRNNRGGNDSFSDYLISYFANKPFTWNSNFTLKTSKFLKEHVKKNHDTTSVFWQKTLSHKDGEIYEYTFEPYSPQPESKRFTGEVYVLANRQSHSQSAVASAQIQDWGFGTIVGEETGDFPSLFASIFQFTLLPFTRTI